MAPQSRPRTTDPTSLTEWIGDHQTTVWRYLRYLGCPDDQAEDIAQDTFLAAIEDGIPDLAPAASSTWLRVTARNLFWNQRRRRRRQQPLPDEAELEAVFSQHAGTDGGDGYLRALRVCVSMLDQRERRVVQLRYGTNQTRDAIAAACGLAPEGIKSLLRRVRARLRACVDQRRQLDG